MNIVHLVEQKVLLITAKILKVLSDGGNTGMVLGKNKFGQPDSGSLFR